MELTINTFSANVVAKCEACGRPDTTLYSVNILSYGGSVEQWCERCCDYHAERCECCGQLVDVNNTEEVCIDGSDDIWCDQCISKDDSVYCCECCGQYTNEDSYQVVGDTESGYEETWCESCREDGASYCDYCERYVTDDLVETVEVYENGQTVERTLCEDCREDYRTCENCGCLIDPDDDAGDNWHTFCPNCGVVHAYDHTYGECFWGDDLHQVYQPSNTLFIGIELETSDNDDIYELARNIDRTFGEWKYVCKQDCTLGDHGLEIVSQPMTPLYHLNSGEWKRIIGFVHEQDGLSHDSGCCGLHMHVSRDFLDEDAPYRLDRLFHRFRDEMIEFSRRDDFEYCRLDEDTLAEIPTVEDRKYEWELKKSCEGRYVAVNLKNDETVEIRLWRGTLNVETFRATIEMTTGLAYVCNSISDEFADELDWEHLKLLIRYALEEHGISHDDFDSYIERRGL